jgi:hypothetical protein
MDPSGDQIGAQLTPLTPAVKVTMSEPSGLARRISTAVQGIFSDVESQAVPTW